jgi:hypothetical protein
MKLDMALSAGRQRTAQTERSGWNIVNSRPVFQQSARLVSLSVSDDFRPWRILGQSEQPVTI